MSTRREIGLVLWSAGAAALLAACGNSFSAVDETPEGGGSSGSGASAVGGTGGASTLPSDAAGGGQIEAGAAGGPDPGACITAQDCGTAVGSCTQAGCVDGACVESPLPERTPCDDGACDATGQCQTSSCSSAKQDGDETDVDCGGSCALCADGAACKENSDCLSGVCTAARCQASACSDVVKNGKETGVDCGGGCPLKCKLGEGCASTADCAVAAGDYPESVRCVAAQCVSTKPPSQGGSPRYWQDFRPERLMSAALSCTAADKVCLVGNVALYQMGGIGTTGVNKAITKALFTTDGVVGGGGKFDGTLCMTRPGTDLSMPSSGAFTVMAWVNSSRKASPWESAIIGGLGHYFIAVDANPTSQRFLAAAATTQSAAFDYRSATATAQLPAGTWHHVAETYDTASAKMIQYVDGKQVNVTALTGNVSSMPVAVYLGCRKDTTVGQFFIGMLDEVVAYPRALSAAELSDYVARTRP